MAYRNVEIVQQLPWPSHEKWGATDNIGRWFPKPEVNFYNVFMRFAPFPSIRLPNNYRVFYYTLRFARMMAREKPDLYLRIYNLPSNTFLLIYPRDMQITKTKRKKKTRKPPKIKNRAPEAYMYQYIQVSAPFSSSPRWFSILRIRNDHRLAERYAGQLRVCENMYGPDNPPRTGIRHVRIFTYTAARRVFETESQARFFMFRCFTEIKTGYREDEIPEYLDRETGENKKVEAMRPEVIVKELRKIELALINKRAKYVKETDILVPILPKNSKTVVVKDIPGELYEEISLIAGREGLAVGSWIKTAIESHIVAMRYRDVGYDKEIFPNIDVSEDQIVFDTPAEGESVLIEDNKVKYVIDF